MMRGVVQSGGTGGNVLPLNQARVTLFDVASGWPAVAGEAKTDRSGAFTLDAPSTDGIFYATANLGGGVVLMALIGTALPAAITINELTTVAAIQSAAQFIERRKIEGDPSALGVAAERNASLVDVETGTSSHVLLRSLANVLASCVRNPKTARDVLFELATPPGGRRPSDIISAMHNIARHPANQVEGIFALSNDVELYEPALASAPESWTL